MRVTEFEDVNKIRTVQIDRTVFFLYKNYFTERYNFHKSYTCQKILMGPKI